MAKSALLLTEQPIVINKELASVIGLNEAIVLQQIEYWVNINEKAKKDQNFKEGYYWTWNTIDKWQEEFPFWSYDTVKRTLKKLRDKKVLVTGKYNAKDYDQTLWYRIDYDVLNKFEEDYKNTLSAKCTNEENQGSTEDKKEETPSEPLKTANSANCTGDIVQPAPMNESNLPQPIPEITTKTSTEISSCSSSVVTEEDFISLFEEEICTLKPSCKKKFINHLNTQDKKFIIAIIAYCSGIDTRSYQGFETVIQSYIKKGILTAEGFVSDVEKFRAERAKARERKARGLKNAAKNNSNKKGSFNNYEQRTYDDVDGLERKLLGWDDMPEDFDPAINFEEKRKEFMDDSNKNN